MSKKVDDNDAPRLEPQHARRNDLAPPGMVGTKTTQSPQEPPRSQEDKIDALEQRLRQTRQAQMDRNTELREGVRGKGESPFLAKRHFDRAKDLDR